MFSFISRIMSVRTSTIYVHSNIWSILLQIVVSFQSVIQVTVCTLTEETIISGKKDGMESTGDPVMFIYVTCGE